VKVDAKLDFEAVFDSLPSPFMVMNADFEIVAANQAYLDVMMRSRESLIGMNVFSAFPAEGDSRRILQDSFERVRDQAIVDVLPVLPYAIPSRQGFEERCWSCTHVPILGENGEVAFLLQNTQDISQLKHSTDLAPLGQAADPRDAGIGRRLEMVQVLNQTLLATAHHLHRLFMQAPNFMAVLQGSDHVIEMANLAFGRLAGGRDLVGKSVREGLPEVASQDYLAILDKVFQTGEPFVGRKMRVFLRNKPSGDIEEYFIDLVCQPIVDENGAPTGIFVEGGDVTEQVRAEQRQAFLIRELHHRVRNTLATVQGVMNTTAKSSATIDEFQEAFTGRIASLAKTHAVMTEKLEQSVSFQHLLNQELGPYTDDQGLRIRLTGPAVDLPSQIAVPLGMAVHELTTNAVKHGALSKEEGRIEVYWTLIKAANGPSLLCEWKELDGPKVTPPLREGFGSMLLNRVLSQQIRAEVNVGYEPDGFRLRMIVPLQVER
jgi:two-component sensor histidine kinase